MGSADGTRLERRLERERRARLEAEAISERTTRELYDRKAELELLETISTACNEAEEMEDALKAVLECVCRHTGWPVGHANVRPDAGTDEVAPSGCWYLDPPEAFGPFVELTNAMQFPSGVGLPGRVLKSSEPHWITDVTEDPNFPRRLAARECGLKSAFAFPVQTGQTCVAVLEFFTPFSADPDESLLALMNHVSYQLARVVERRHSEDELEALNRRTQALLSSAGEGIYGIDRHGRTTFVNPAAARMLGRDPKDLIGRSIHDVVHGGPDGDGYHEQPDCPLILACANGARLKEEDVFTRGTDTPLAVEFISTPIESPDGTGGAVVTFRDIGERKRFEAQLRYLADHDALTGLLNRRRFEQDLGGHVALAARYGTPSGVLMIDLDSFKVVNDSLGHHAGDELIRNVANLLKRRLRETDVVARLGGDEFAILLPRAEQDRTETVAADLVNAIREHPMAVGDKPVRVTASVGITLVTAGEGTADDVLVEADLAMYAAKDQGRDRCVLFEPDIAQDLELKVGVTWSERIRSALAENRFVLYQQPILDLASGRISQYELLLRMMEDDTIVPPGSFLPQAERFGLIQEIDRWVVTEAIQILARLHRQDPSVEVHVEINLSGKSVGDPELTNLIQRELDAAGIEASRLIFEITETAAIANMEEARKFAERLTALGCRLALDDFGAGFGSFYYLKYLKLDYLKLDGDFIRTLPRSPIDQRMVKAMVEVAKGLEMQTIAEFVEDGETVELLKEFGVDFAQGFHVGRPAPIASMDL